MPASTRRGASGCGAPRHPARALPPPARHCCLTKARAFLKALTFHAHCRFYNEEDLAFVNGILGAQRLAKLGFEQITSNHLKRAVRKPAPSVWEATQHRRMSGLLDHPRWDRIGR